MYDSSINYGVSAPKDHSFNTEEGFSVNDMLTLLGNLSKRLATGNAARALALDGSQQYGEIFRLILGGSLRAGISVTTINKAYPGLIPVFKVMLAKDVPVRKFPCIASTKYDGVRLTAFVVFSTTGDTLVRLILRSGKQIHIKSLEYEMSRQPAGVYDGELVAGDGLQESRTKITGSVNRCLKGSDTDIKDFTFCIFDMLDHAEWTEQQTSRPYIKRILTMNEGLKQNSKVRMADLCTMTDLDMVNAFYADRLAHGYEGIIVRYSHDPYEWKRSEKLIKMKATKECVLECVGTTEGTGKYAGMIGALNCRGSLGDTYIMVKLGSGLTDHDREMPPSHFIGKDIDVLYNDIVKSETNDFHSLFLPRFKRILGDHNV